MHALEMLRLVPINLWLEKQTDFMSVQQATFFSGEPLTFRERMRAHIRFFRRVEDR